MASDTGPVSRKFSAELKAATDILYVVSGERPFIVAEFSDPWTTTVAAPDSELLALTT